MTYNPPLVLLYPGVPTTTNIQSEGLTGFPGTFDHFLLSMWVCLGRDSANRGVSFVNTIPFCNIHIDTTTISISLLPGMTLSAIFNGTYSIPYTSYRYNLLISIDGPHQNLQVYLNDAKLTLSTGGWTEPGSFSLAGGFSLWQLLGAGSAAPGAGVGDVYAAAPNDFFDLDQTINRRKFINADLTAVDLIPHAIGPLGTMPPIFLSSENGIPNDIATNYGSGGSFTILGGNLIYQVAGSCDLPPSPPSLYEVTNPTADFPPSFSQFSLSVWCCKEVNISSPGLQMAFTPSAIDIVAKDASSNTLFSGSWTNPSAVTDEYQVLFSLNTVAQTYTLYVTNRLWTVVSATFPHAGEINNA